MTGSVGVFMFPVEVLVIARSTEQKVPWVIMKLFCLVLERGGFHF